MSSSSWVAMATPSFFFFFAFLLLVIFSPLPLHAGIDIYSLGPHGCTNSTPSFPSARFPQFLSSLVSHSNSSFYFNSSFSDQIYGFYQCRGDLSLPQCSSCVFAASNYSILLPSCPPDGAAVGYAFLEGCTLIFKNYSFYIDDLGNPNQLMWAWNTDNNTDSAWRTNRDKALNLVAAAAPLNGGFSATYVGPASEGVYALVQCQGYLSPQDCQQCLSRINDVQRLFNNFKGGIIWYWSCFYRFETYLFYQENVSSPSPAAPLSPQTGSLPGGQSTSGSSTFMIIGAALASSAVVLFLCTVTALSAGKRKRKARSPTVGGAVRDEETEMQPTFQTRLFSLEEMKRATQNFHSTNLLGEGGFGSVYKGTLDDGEVVAIKKISFFNPHGRRQFLNEVSLILLVQHRNLIKLIGCCVEDQERLLIYEYLPNKSLDKHLFEGGSLLPWTTRMRIILGTAKGLAYLHEDSQFPIVHRDIKPANVLLDEHMNPKIADFGLARLFPEDQSHMSSLIAGTLGYLAPEYALHGQLTEKADVFSFGLVALETMSGRKNTDRSLPGEQQHLLQWAWKLFREGRQVSLVDPRLEAQFNANEAIHLVHVALLCTQAVAGLRPMMSKVVVMLMGQSEILERPIQPAFVEQQDMMRRIMTLEDGARQMVNNTAPMYLPPLESPTSSIETPLVNVAMPIGLYDNDGAFVSRISLVEPR